METIRYATGDATLPEGDGMRVIIHVVNDGGFWGKGFVVALGKRYPLAKQEYERWQRGWATGCPRWGLGELQIVQVRDTLVVANMMAQRGIYHSHYNPHPLSYIALGECLNHVQDFAWSHKATVHAPRLGSGYAGGDWSRIEQMLRSHLTHFDIPVTIYDLPTGEGDD